MIDVHMTDCKEILEEARKLIPGRLGQLDELINELEGKSLKEQRNVIWNKIERKSEDDILLKPLYIFSTKPFLIFGSANLTDSFFSAFEAISHPILEKIKPIIDKLSGNAQTDKDHTNTQGSRGNIDWDSKTAYNLILCSIYLFVELILQTEDIDRARESYKSSYQTSRDQTPPKSFSSNEKYSNSPTRKRREEGKQKKESSTSAQSLSSVSPAAATSNIHFCELRMLVESTYITSFESLKDNPDQELTEEYLEALFKRPNIHKLHGRKKSMPLGERSFRYENGESLLEHVAQLYLCINIELFDWTDERYQELLSTKSFAVMKRRLRGAKFTLRELRYEKLNDTDRVISGEN